MLMEIHEYWQHCFYAHKYPFLQWFHIGKWVVEVDKLLFFVKKKKKEREKRKKNEKKERHNREFLDKKL